MRYVEQIIISTLKNMYNTNDQRACSLQYYTLLLLRLKIRITQNIKIRLNKKLCIIILQLAVRKILKIINHIPTVSDNREKEMKHQIKVDSK